MVDMLIPAKEVARNVSIVDVMRKLGITVDRRKKRANCPFCRGNSKWTVSLTTRMFNCHRCGLGGDVFRLVERVQGCDFKCALGFVAEMAGIPQSNCNVAQLREQLREQRRHREAIDKAAATIDERERTLRCEYSREIHQYIRLKQRASQRLRQIQSGAPEQFTDEAETLWALIEAAQLNLERATAAHILLSHGRIEDRTKFALGSASDRERHINATLAAGYVNNDSGQRIEVAL
jgi:DNA primase